MDQLTGLPTHRELPRAFAESTRHPAAACLTAVLFDIDGLIWVNDQHGHAEGDRTLVRVAGWLESRLGAHGSELFRVSGDEFLALLHEKSLQDAVVLAREVLGDFERLRIPYARTSDARDFLAMNAVVFTAYAGLEGDMQRLRDDWANAIYNTKRAEGRPYSVVAVID